MAIEKFSGTDPQLYKLVAPLVMSPTILRQNNNYPFKTSRHHVWFIFIENHTVSGFIPVETKARYVTIDNYYISGDNVEILAQMIDQVVNTFKEEYPIYSVTHTRHASVFQKKGFSIVKKWKLYVKMKWDEDEDENGSKECI